MPLTLPVKALLRRNRLGHGGRNMMGVSAGGLKGPTCADPRYKPRVMSNSGGDIKVTCLCIKLMLQQDAEIVSITLPQHYLFCEVGIVFVRSPFPIQPIGHFPVLFPALVDFSKSYNCHHFFQAWKV